MLDDGTERGIRVLEFRTGGLRFDVLADRAMDIGLAEFDDLSVGWRSATGAEIRLTDTVTLGAMTVGVWDNFAVISGSAAGALTGLLFVAVSLNRERIVGHEALHGEAGQTLVLFLLALLLSLVLVIPGTSARTLGVVLVAIALGSGTILTLIGRPGRDITGRRDATRERGMASDQGGNTPPGDDGTGAADRLARLVNTVSPNLFTMLLIIIAGCLQLAGDDGLYWLAAAVVLSLIGGVVNAWLFLTR